MTKLEKELDNISNEIKSDDFDINKTWLSGFFGGNGDIYLTIVSEDNKGIRSSVSVRISTSGGNFNTDSKIAAANLIRSIT